MLSGDSTHTRMVVGPCNLVYDQLHFKRRMPSHNRFIKNTEVQIASAQKERGTEDAIINVRPLSEIWRFLRSTKPFCCVWCLWTRKTMVNPLFITKTAKTRVIRFPTTITLKDLECHTTRNGFSTKAINRVKQTEFLCRINRNVRGQ